MAFTFLTVYKGWKGGESAFPFRNLFSSPKYSEIFYLYVVTYEFSLMIVCKKWNY